MTTIGDHIAHLRATGEHLSEDLRKAILADGEAHVDELLAIVADDNLSMEDAPGAGWPPIHAVDLLCTIKSTKGLDLLVETLRFGDWDSILHDRLLLRLASYGADVMEPALAALAEAESEDEQQSLCALLATLGVRDDRIFDALVRSMKGDLCFAALHFATYGDPRALPYIEEAIERFVPDMGNYHYCGILPRKFPA